MVPCNTTHRIFVEDFVVKLLDWVNDSVAVRSRQCQPCGVRGSSQVSQNSDPQKCRFLLLILTFGEVIFVFGV